MNKKNLNIFINFLTNLPSNFHKVKLAFQEALRSCPKYENIPAKQNVSILILLSSFIFLILSSTHLERFGELELDSIIRFISFLCLLTYFFMEVSFRMATFTELINKENKEPIFLKTLYYTLLIKTSSQVFLLVCFCLLGVYILDSNTALLN